MGLSSQTKELESLWNRLFAPLGTAGRLPANKKHQQNTEDIGRASGAPPLLLEFGQQGIAGELVGNVKSFYQTDCCDFRWVWVKTR